MTKLSISELEFKNFLSYGDYETKLNLSKMGPVLIVGDKSDNGTRDFRKSNGAGKSTITTAIVWVLFGKTFSLSNPGDKVVNWHIERDCLVRLKTTDGWEITRTRKMDGYNELSVFHNGEDKTLSTPTNTQKFLNKQFGLDFDIFTSSIFFGQFSKPFLEMGDQKRKAALERLLNLDKLNVWAATAKNKIDKAEIELTKCTTKIDSNTAELERLEEQINTVKELEGEYETTRAQRIADHEDDIAQKRKELGTIEIPDLQRLRDRWAAIAKIESKLNEYGLKLDKIEEEKDNLAGKIESNQNRITRLAGQEAQEYDLEALEKEHRDRKELLEAADAIQSVLTELMQKSTTKQLTLEDRAKTIKEWTDASGQICTTCKQPITAKHSDDMCKPLLEEVSILKGEIKAIEDGITAAEKDLNDIPEVPNPMSIEEARRINKSISAVHDDIAQMKAENETATTTIGSLDKEAESITKLVGRVRKQADAATPDITVDAALELESKKNLLKQAIETAEGQITTLREEANPHSQQLGVIKQQAVAIGDQIKVISQTRSKLDIFYTHLSYIRNAYKDRKKIKQFILSSLIPLLNRRIQYYLESFSCEFAMEFTPTLATLPSKWDYSLCSGGERKRIDMSVMFALYDLYIHMHGQQCNLMVLDEVDGRLDSEGIEAFIDVINNDFCDESGTRPRPDSILIISHRPEMLDAFPSKILVRKKESFSFIESII